MEKLLATAEPIEVTKTEHKWETPLPMENIKPTSTFPIKCIPQKIRRYIEAVAEHTQTPVDMASVAALAVIATTIQGKYEIESKKGYTEPLNLYCMVVAKPAERKTAVTKDMSKPIYTYEKVENEKRKLIIAKQQNELNIKKAQIDRLEKKREN